MLVSDKISEYYTELQEDIKSSLLAEEEGANPEQIFTDIALSILADSGETENYRVCYDEKLNKRGVVHKVNAYSLYENYETLDLFITIYNSEDEIETVPKSDTDKAFNRLTKFFMNAANNSYVNEIEESSEIFDLAHTLCKVDDVFQNLVRINVIVLTNGEFKSEYKISEQLATFNLYYRVIDINYLYNLSKKSREPIEIDFQELGIPLPCISSNVELEGYQSYLAIIPGSVLAHIYERYGLRLLEQNVRTFLQFTGKINRGIRNTIQKEPHMFLAFNNGIAATAEEVEFIDDPLGQGKAISKIRDLQIVNGGQTTAAIYHAWKKFNADITNIYVQMKLTTIKDESKFTETVGRIAEYANTQNKISIADLSANRESLIKLEHLSRTIWAPPQKGSTLQTRWFFERSRGQYKNERLMNGSTKSKRNQYELSNPLKQMFTKENLAKFVNSYQEIYVNKKLVIGPHHVVRGSQKNYAQFLQHNLLENPDEIYFQDTVAKAIIFKTAEKVYGVKPNSIGDMRYITVPYSIAWTMAKTSGKVNLFKIWKEQSLSEGFKQLLYDVMYNIESYIKEKAPGALYGEWAKKEDCWSKLKIEDFDVKIDLIKDYLKKDNTERKSTETDTDVLLRKEMHERVKNLGSDNWKQIYLWLKESDNFSQFYVDVAHTIGRKIKNQINLSAIEILRANMLLEEIAKESNFLERIYNNFDGNDQ